MKRGTTGRHEITSVGGERIRAFVPLPLPPAPPLALDGALHAKLEEALLALGRLDGLSTLLPDTSLFLYSYVRKEAVLSSQIEGTQSSLSDLLLYEMRGAPGVPMDDVIEASNYVAAMEHGLARLRGGFPLSNRLIREIHEKLLARGRGSDKEPGSFRRSQNWIGGTRPGNALFVPPPPNAVASSMSELEKFLHRRKEPLPILIRAGLAHAQFETIHPFLDGNGRVGRLLITLFLCHAGVLKEPMLYLSLHFKKERRKYYRLLSDVRTKGDWEAWLSFFLEGVRLTADGAVSTARRLTDLFAEDEERIRKRGRAAGSAVLIHQVLKMRPIISLHEAGTRAGISFPTASTGMKLLEELGIARELTGKKRDRLFSYARYIEILSEGTEPL
ncbi:MAG: Fic family protein [Candidatus Krumholzibacteriia bacterium]